MRRERLLALSAAVSVAGVFAAVAFRVALALAAAGRARSTTSRTVKGTVGITFEAVVNSSLCVYEEKLALG